MIHLAAILLLAASQGTAPPPHVHPPYRCRGCKNPHHVDPRPIDEFRSTNPCPSTGKNTGDCPGYRITFITPLENGGSDTPLNYQWVPVPKR